MQNTVDINGYQICHVDQKTMYGNILREKRLVLEMTQQQVAEKAKVALRQYQKFESNERNIMTASFQLASRVIEALGMNISDFYHGKYVLGEKVYSAGDGKLRYVKTDRDINEDITEENVNQ